MPLTQTRSEQIENSGIYREDLALEVIQPIDEATSNIISLQDAMSEVQLQLTSIEVGQDHRVIRISGDLTLSGDHYRVICDGPNLNVTLPDPVVYKGFPFIVANENITKVTLIGTIDDETNPKLRQWESLTFFGDGTKFKV